MSKLDKNNLLYTSIKGIVENARQIAYRSNNSILLKMYWEIGRIIVEDQQQGQSKAAYGKAVLKNLATQLTL